MIATRPRTSVMPAQDRRAATVDAVIALAANGNPAAITTAAIAAAMGVTQGALFRHFPDKDAIWAAVMASVATRLLARIDAAADAAPTPLAALRAVFMAHVAFAIEHPGVPRLLFGELQRAESTPAKRETQRLLKVYGERLRRHLSAAKAADEIATDLDDNAAVMTFIGSIQGLVMQSLLAGDLRHMRDAAPGVFDLLRNGFGARP
ncbi:MAG TPA: TetR/AcrR family transcriptional regulator [Patescibacteria group bacterium]|nr:TetR/AcrR family transcriptional regulator [Patescibacteria group bacterium]